MDQLQTEDITTKFSNCEVKRHRILLAAASGYFYALCNLKGGFKEGDRQIIELKEDDPDALYTVLRYVYGFDYEQEYAKDEQDVEFHLKVCIAARKYLLPELETQAFKALRAAICYLQKFEVAWKVVSR